MRHRGHEGMPQLKFHLAGRHHQDPLTACLDANGTYICTAYNSRCYIIQKVTPPITAKLNPDAEVFECKAKITHHSDSYEMVESDFPPLEGNVLMNGDVGKVPPGAVFAASPEPTTPTTEYSLLNGTSETVGGGGPAGGLETYPERGGGVGGHLSATTGPTAPATAPDQATPAPLDPALLPAPMPLDTLKQLLSSQLEYYFSRENLANDTYLLSQMDNDQYVPIWTVANFNQVKKLTTDIKLITEVLRESPNVQVDDEGQKVRPNHKRCIVILREIPDSTPLDEVKSLFSGKGCPKLISCEFAHNNSWYVTFENDEDAQKAYRFLREEVREFQGKPIMARIKAKPMNRLPMPPGLGTVAGMSLKNGYRTPPAPATGAAPGANVYDPTAAAPFPQPAPGQRYLFSNGSSLPHNVNYTNQVQIYVSNFQQHQPFYPPSMLPTWGPTSPAYFDIGSVFSVNGLAPQGGPFTKSHSTRFTPRNSRQKKSGGLEARTAMSDSGIMRKPTKETGRFDSQEMSQRHEDDSNFRVTSSSKEQTLPPRRRRKEEEVVVGGGVGSRTSGSPGPQFDLEADAFPPLPGGGQPTVPDPPPVQPAGGALHSASGQPPAALPPGHQAGSHQDPTTLPPTSSPAAAVCPAAPPLSDHPPLPWSENRTMTGGGGKYSDKGGGVQKTEDGVGVVGGGTGALNGETPDQSQPTATPAPAPLHDQPQPHQVELGVVKLSYAQVAQHHKERVEREKQAREQQQQQQQLAHPAPSPAAQQHSDDEKKDQPHPPSGFQYQPKGDGSLGRGRGGGGARGGGPRRRDNVPRQFNSRQRSPK